MKRYIKCIRYMVATLVLGCILLQLTGCNQQDVQETRDPHQPFISWIVEKFYTEEEVRAFGDSKKAPPNFVDYSAVSMIGELIQMEYSYYYDRHSFTCYDYVLIDENGYKIRIKVSHNGDYTDRFGNKLVTEPEKSYMTSMQGPVATKESKWIMRDHVGYLYQHQNLVGIIWMPVRNLELHFYVREPYPMDGADTFMRRLLSLSEEEALAAVYELEENIHAYRSEVNWLIPAGVGVVVVALGVVGFVVWKKKKRKAAASKADKTDSDETATDETATGVKVWISEQE